MHELEGRIGYRFAARERLVEALTHRSTLGDLKPGEERISYERLEFLGDSVLSLVTSDFLMRNFPGGERRPAHEEEVAAREQGRAFEEGR